MSYSFDAPNEASAPAVLSVIIILKHVVVVA